MSSKLKRKTTPTEADRTKTLEDRLDAAMAESKRLGRELDELQAREPLHGLRWTLRHRYRQRPAPAMERYEPDDAVT